MYHMIPVDGYWDYASLHDSLGDDIITMATIAEVQQLHTQADYNEIMYTLLYSCTRNVNNAMFREWKLYNSYLYDRLLTIYDGMYCCDVILVILAGLRTTNSYSQ